MKITIVLPLCCLVTACVVQSEPSPGPQGELGPPGVANFCQPGSFAYCGSVDPGLHGIGICRSGTTTCSDEGTGWSDCSPGIGPNAAGEDCSTPEDDDCDGTANESDAGCVCAPGTSAPCYSGTEFVTGVGACRAGTQTCTAAGTGYGPCLDEVRPTIELCGTSLDENCDGDPGCHGLEAWSARFGDSSSQEPRAVAVDTFGHVVVSGYYQGTLDFGGIVLANPNSTGIFLVAFDAAGSHLWSRGFSDTVDSSVNNAAGIAVDEGGNIFLTGYVSGSVDFGCGTPAVSAGARDVVVVKFDSFGACQWFRAFGDAENQAGAAIAVDSSGAILVAGNFQGALDFAPGIHSSTGARDMFLAKLDSSTGNTLWSSSFGDAAEQEARAVRVDNNGNVLLAGYIEGAVTFGGPLLTSAGHQDVFIAKFEGSGEHIWSARFGDANGDQSASDVVVDANGDVFLTGSFQGAIDFGPLPLVAEGTHDSFLTKLDPAGTHLWSRRYGDAADQHGRRAALDSTGNVVLLGDAFGGIDLGCGPFPGNDSFDIFAAKIDGAGNCIWARRFGDSGSQLAEGLAVDSLGNTLVVGELVGLDSTIDFGSGPLVSAGGADIFIAQLAP